MADSNEMKSMNHPSASLPFQKCVNVAKIIVKVMEK